MENKLTAVNSANTNFKMYKSGKRWLFACSMIVSSLAAMGVATSVHADTTTTNNSGAQPQVTQTQANTNSSTNTSTSSTAGNNATGNSIAASLKSAGGNGSNQTIKTYPNKSEIDQAVSNAKQQPNLNISKDPDQEITGNSKEEIDQKIKNDYAQQEQLIEAKKEQAKKAAEAKQNYDRYNNMHGNTGILDNSVKDAKNVPGLTVKKDADQTTTINASDSDAIRNWSTNTQSDYEAQTKAIQNAIATQKQNYNAWKEKYDKQMAGVDPTKAVKTDNVYVPNQLVFSNTNVDVTINQPNTKDTIVHGSLWDKSYNSAHQYLIKDPQDGLTITWHKAATDKRTGKLLDITWTISDIVKVPKGDPSNWASELVKLYSLHGWNAPSQEIIDAESESTITVYSNPLDEIGWANIAGFKVNEKLTYSDDGSDYQGVYYRSAGSLNAQYTGDRWEFAAPINGVLGSFISNDSLIVPQEQQVSGKASSVTDKAFMIGPNKEHGREVGGAYGDKTPDALTKEGITFLVKNGSTIAYGISGKTGSNQDAVGTINETYLITAYNEHLMGSTQLVAASVHMPTSSVHYHYDTS